jgi:hypothetical protein
VEEPPQHFHMDKLGSASPATPTTSAPSLLLKRFFKTKVQDELPTVSHSHVSSSSSGSALSDDLPCRDSSFATVGAMQLEIETDFSQAGPQQDNGFTHFDTLSPPGEGFHNAFTHIDTPTSPAGCQNDFAHFDTPTSSEAGFLVQQMCEATNDPNDNVNLLKCPPLSKRFVLTLNDKVSEASTSAAGSFVPSPVDMAEAAAPMDFALNVKTSKNLAHNAGKCTPCNYFWHKVDGCRQGDECSFCHLCPKTEIKQRRKDKLRQLRKAGLLRR